jgi:hypothetical protein
VRGLSRNWDIVSHIPALFGLYVFALLCFISIYISMWGRGVVVFNATFNNILAISWRLVLLVEGTGVL